MPALPSLKALLTPRGPTCTEEALHAPAPRKASTCRIRDSVTAATKSTKSPQLVMLHRCQSCWESCYHSISRPFSQLHSPTRDRAYSRHSALHLPIFANNSWSRLRFSKNVHYFPLHHAVNWYNLIFASRLQVARKPDGSPPLSRCYSSAYPTDRDSLAELFEIIRRKGERHQICIIFFYTGGSGSSLLVNQAGEEYISILWRKKI